MRIRHKRTMLSMLVATLAIVLTVSVIMAQPEVQDVLPRDEGAADDTAATPDLRSMWAFQDIWTIQQPDQAIARALELLGLFHADQIDVTAELVALEEDNTPFLYELIIRRPIWHVVVSDWKLELESAAPHVEDSYSRTFDVFIDPETTGLLKIISRWPEGVPRIPREAGAASATDQVRDSGAERYHAFPQEDPSVNFLQALDAVRSQCENPLVAEQIVGRYIVWSMMGRDPQAVWAITVRGTRALWEPAFDVPGDSVNALNHMRLIVDAQTGTCLFGGNSPGPESDTPEPDDAPNPWIVIPPLVAP